MTKTLLTLSILFLAIGFSACQGDDSDEAASESSASLPAASASSATTAESAVEYEPAYPTDVSGDDLTAGDVAQQETHSHDGGEEHSHDDGEEHSHDDGGHDHGKDGHDDDHQH